MPAARPRDVLTCPPPPVEEPLDEHDPRTALQGGVRNALLAVPAHFRLDSRISDVDAHDLFGLHSLLRDAIEGEVVRALNRLREVWDPQGQWPGCSFERSRSAFPGVRLVRQQPDGPWIVFGIVLHAWFLLAKEGAPDLRYRATPAACAAHDLICVVPWHLSAATAGTVRVVQPWVASARFTALWRDHCWERSRRSTGSVEGIYHPPDAQPYPARTAHADAYPDEDSCREFGSLPGCTPLMDDFLARTWRHEVLGIPARDWYLFLRAHSETATSYDVTAALQVRLYERLGPINSATAREVLALLEELSTLFRP